MPKYGYREIADLGSMRSTMDAALRAIKPEPINDEQTMQLD